MSIVPVSIVIWTVPLDLSFHLIVCRIMFFLFVFFKLLYVVFFEFWSLIRPPHPAITCSVFFLFFKAYPSNGRPNYLPATPPPHFTVREDPAV